MPDRQWRGRCARCAAARDHQVGREGRAGASAPAHQPGLPANPVLPRALDQAREKARGDAKIGTTGRGIGPAYEDKVARRAIRVGDLFHRDQLAAKLGELLAYHNFVLTNYYKEEPVDFQTTLDELLGYAEVIRPMVADVTELLRLHIKRGDNVLFEGAQGALLDVDHGTYPYVTSSNTTAGGAATGSGVGPRNLDYVLGIVKAYATRVGSGPFPTEQENEIGQHIRDKGQEYGTVTKRPRRCGWFDAVAARRSIFNNSVTGLCVTKLDVLDELDVIRICVGYQADGVPVEVPPIGAEGFSKIEPIYEELPGWKTSTYGVTRYDACPRRRALSGAGPPGDGDRDCDHLDRPGPRAHNRLAQSLRLIVEAISSRLLPTITSLGAAGTGSVPNSGAQTKNRLRAGLFVWCREEDSNLHGFTR